MAERAVIARPATEEAWLELRRPFSNASSAAVHVREHEHVSIADWFVEKRTGASKEETRAMTRGKWLERAVGEWYADECGLALSPLNVVFTYGRLMATPDFEFVGSNVGLEVKATPGRTSPRSRYWQCVGLLAASDWDSVHLIELHAGDYVPTVLHRDEPRVAADIERLMAAIEEDWSWVDLGIPPPDAVFDADQVFDLWPVPPVAKVELPEEAVALAFELKAARTRAGEGEKRAKYARDALADALRDAEVGTYNGEPVVTFKANKPSIVFDMARFRRELPDVHARYTVKKDGARMMRVVGEVPAAPVSAEEVGF